jgi:hypothetical protein
MKSTLVD